MSNHRQPDRPDPFDAAAARYRLPQRLTLPMTNNTTWLFDLDNTLHDASRHIFPKISRLMMAYICRELNIDETQARALRLKYWSQYGATLLGMMRHHQVDPHDFLEKTHDLPDLEKLVVAERSLKPMLQRLAGRKILFSNAPQRYVAIVLATLDIGQYFDAIYCIEQLRFQPKPAVAGFLRLLKNESLNPKSCTMVEDTLPNLQTAKRLGMKTVWVSQEMRRPPYVDVKIATIRDLPRRVKPL